MKILKYANEYITILWKPDLCKHAGVCVKTLPKVYNPKARPWINIENASTEDLKKQVSACPTRALTFIEKNNLATKKLRLKNEAFFITLGICIGILYNYGLKL